jgi:hypothetical protein
MGIGARGGWRLLVRCFGFFFLMTSNLFNDSLLQLFRFLLLGRCGLFASYREQKSPERNHRDKQNENETAANKLQPAAHWMQTPVLPNLVTILTRKNEPNRSCHKIAEPQREIHKHLEDGDEQIAER